MGARPSPHFLGRENFELSQFTVCLVLAGAMSAFIRMICILIGTTVAVALAYEVIGFVGHWYEMNVARSDDDLSRAYVVYLLVLLCSAVIGGLVGNLLYSRRLAGRSSERSEGS